LEPLVFVSYRRADSSAAARSLADSIRRVFGPQYVFIDTESIRMADDWPDRINSALASATIVLPIIGPSWLRMADDYGRRRLDRPDDWVCNEILHALQRKLPIIPILLSKSPMPVREALPESIKDLWRIQGFELRDDRWEADLSAVFDRLVELGLKRTGGITEQHGKRVDQSEILHSIMRDHALRASVEIDAPLERVWHLIDDDDARQTWDKELATYEVHYLTEPKSAGTRFVVKRRKSNLFNVILQGTLHAYLPPRAMSQRLDSPLRIHVFRTLILSRNRNMTKVENYLGFSSEVKYLPFIFRWLFSKGERQDLERLKAAAEAQLLE
jgi:hypothetical protein